MNRQRMILLVLMALLLIAVVTSYLRMPRQKTVAQLTHRPGVRAAIRTDTLASPNSVQSGRIRLDLLEAGLPPAQETKRNLFASVQRERQLSATKSQPAARMAVIPPVAAPPPPSPQELMKRSLSGYTFIGLTTIGGRKTAFFTKGGEVVPVRIGDRLAGRYEAIGMSDEFLTIKSPDGGEQISLPLLERQPSSFIRRNGAQPRQQGLRRPVQGDTT